MATAVSPLKLDPSRTTTLRAQFMADLGRRFRALWKAVEELVVEEDAFGLVPNKPLFNTRWKFTTDDTKVKNFQRWFQEQVDAKLLSVDNETGEPWTSKYVGSAHRTGVVRSFVEINKELLSGPSQFYAGSKAQFLRDAFNQPEVVSKVKLIYTRAYDELKGVTEKMGKDMSRVLAAGIARGANPRELARELSREVQMSRERANRVARTEIIHAHAEGQLDGMEQLGVEEVGIQVEWSTAGDARVCQQCSGMEGTVLTVKEARGRIPLHPNCRCAWIPYIGRNLPSSRARLQKKVAKQAAQKTQAPSPQLWNHQPTAVLRWMGDQGWSFDEARAVMDSIGVNVKDNTIKWQLREGRVKKEGLAIAPLTPDQQAQLNAWRSALPPGPTKKVVKPKPTKVVKPKPQPVVPPPPPPPPPPPVTPPPPPTPVVTTPAKVDKVATTTPNPTPPAAVVPKGKPAHITFTGQETDLTKKVWAEIGDGIKDVDQAKRVGRLLRDEIQQQIKSLEKELDIGRLNDKYLEVVRNERELIKAFEYDWSKYKDNPKYLEWSKQRSELSVELAIRRDKLATAKQEVVGKVLAQVRDMGGGKVTIVAAKRHEGAKLALQRAAQLMPKDWIDTIGKKMTLQAKVTARGYFSHNGIGMGISEIAVSGTSKTAANNITTAVHELTHAMEYSHPTMVRLEREFIEGRIKPGESKTPINGRRTELGWRDEFLDHYMGRDYGGRAWEVTAMAVDSLLTKKYYSLLDDKDHSEFALGLLAGL